MARSSHHLFRDPGLAVQAANPVTRRQGEPCVWQGQNKVLFKRMLSTPQQPDYFLVVVRSSEVGHLDVGSPAWRSEGTLLISFSECRDEQEAMLLMPLDSWLRTDLGKFVLLPFVSWPWSARLQLESA